MEKDGKKKKKKNKKRIYNIRKKEFEVFFDIFHIFADAFAISVFEKGGQGKGREGEFLTKVLLDRCFLK